MSLFDREIVRRKAGGHDPNGPVEFRKDVRGTRVRADDQVFHAQDRGGRADLDSGPFCSKSTVLTGQHGIHFAHPVGTGDVQGLSGDRWSQTVLPGAVVVGVPSHGCDRAFMHREDDCGIPGNRGGRDGEHSQDRRVKKYLVHI